MLLSVLLQAAAAGVGVSKLICLMAKENEQINPSITEIPQYLLDKHYYRKHGAHAYYGQG